MTNARHDSFIVSLRQRWGREGVCRWWEILEIIASEMDISNRCEATFISGYWTRELGFRSANDARSFIQWLAIGGRLVVDLSSNEWLVRCPKLLKIRARQNAVGNESCTLDIDIDIDTDTEPLKPPRIVSKKPEPQDQNFEKFWAEYPNKKAKARAVVVWRKLGIENGKLETIMAALRRQKTSDQWTKDGGQFIPHPTTWLNQRRWEDQEPEALKPKTWMDTFDEEVRNDTGRIQNKF